MRWPWRKRVPQATEEAQSAAAESVRGLQDARAMHAQASTANRKAEDVAARLEETKRRNHVAEAVDAAVTRWVRRV